MISEQSNFWIPLLQFKDEFYLVASDDGKPSRCGRLYFTLNELTALYRRSSNNVTDEDAESTAELIKNTAKAVEVNLEVFQKFLGDDEYIMVDNIGLNDDIISAYKLSGPSSEIIKYYVQGIAPDF